MLEIIREYALERLQEVHEDGGVRARHLAFCLELAKAAEPRLDGPDQTLWLDRLERDHDNLRAALAWSAQGAEPVLGLRLATALLFFWFLHGHVREGRERLQTALDAAGANAYAWTRGRGQAALGHLLLVQGQSGEARMRFEAALTLARELNDGATATFALRYLGILASRDGDFESAGRFLEESLAIARRIGAGLDVAMALAYLGDLALRDDALERARGLFEECADILRQLQNNSLLAYPLRRLGWLAHLRGDIPLAVRLGVESVRRNRDGGERLSVAASLVGLAPIAESQGQAECAVLLLSKADALASSIGGQMLPFESAQFESAVARMRERLEPAAWARAWHDGQQLSLDEAISMAEALVHGAAEATSEPRSRVTS
jgi:tetratricopeptide (TPR) repeat protein